MRSGPARPVPRPVPGPMCPAARSTRLEDVIHVENLTKRYGSNVVVDAFTFTVPTGAVTGFLGPNGAGKSTTLRMILGLTHPDAGTATIDGRAYRQLRQPLRQV